jgi:hypothetical protein
MIMLSNAVGHSEIMRPLAHAFSRKAVPDRTERSSKGLLRSWRAWDDCGRVTRLQQAHAVGRVLA